MSDTSDPAELVAAHVYYSGRVQGVGFRATVAWLARTYPITGWVQNLPDGRVELLVEGPHAKLSEFLDAISLRFAGKIRGEEAHWQPASGLFPSFQAIR